MSNKAPPGVTCGEATAQTAYREQIVVDGGLIEIILIVRDQGPSAYIARSSHSRGGKPPRQLIVVSSWTTRCANSCVSPVTSKSSLSGEIAMIKMLYEVKARPPVHTLENRTAKCPHSFLATAADLAGPHASIKPSKIASLGCLKRTDAI